MSQTTIPQTIEEHQGAVARAAAEAEAPKQLDALHTEHGDTTIADTVVAKIAGMAAREVPGVYSMGNAARQYRDDQQRGGRGDVAAARGMDRWQTRRA